MSAPMTFEAWIVLEFAAALARLTLVTVSPAFP